MDQYKRTPEEEHHRQNQIAKQDKSGKMAYLKSADTLLSDTRKTSIQHPFFYSKKSPSKIISIENHLESSFSSTASHIEESGDDHEITQS